MVQQNNIKLFYKFLKKQNALEKFITKVKEEHLTNDDVSNFLRKNSTQKEKYISCAFFWCEDTFEYFYWDNLIDEWSIFLKKYGKYTD